MAVKAIRQLTDKDFTHKGVPEFNLSVEDYSMVLDSVVTANADIVLFQPGGEVALGMRVDRPLQGELWLFGGRMKPGESLDDTALRHLKREVGIKGDKSRMSLSNVYNIMWGGRAEPPQEFGFQTMMSILTYECSPEEATIVTTADRTHSNLKWYSHQELLELQEKGELHPFLITVLTDAGLL